MLISEIAIIVPVYNTGKYKLSKCIQSILAQTYRHFTLILVDDGSTDDSGKVWINLRKKILESKCFTKSIKDV